MCRKTSEPVFIPDQAAATPSLPASVRLWVGSRFRTEIQRMVVLSGQPVSETCGTTGAPGNNVLSLVLPTRQIRSGKMLHAFFSFKVAKI